ncbi:hypothetical protein JCM3766R1_002608 [Sporobolomyces carnicolor]
MLNSVARTRNVSSREGRPSSPSTMTPTTVVDVKARPSLANFDELSPLEQVKHALSLPVPKTFVRLESSILDAALAITAAKEVSQDATPHDFPFCSLKQLAFYGDRLWSEVTACVLLSMRTKGELQNQGTAGKLAKLGHLVTDNIARKYTVDTGLKDFYKLDGADQKRLADVWEAFLGALFLEQGRQSLLEFLVPIVKLEYDLPANVHAVHVTKKSSSPSNRTPFEKSQTGVPEALDNVRLSVARNLAHLVLEHGARTKPVVQDIAASDLEIRKLENLDVSSLPNKADAVQSSDSTSNSKLEGGDSRDVPGTEAPSKEQARLEILALPKMEPLVFASPDDAKSQFLSALTAEKIPHILDLCTSSRRSSLQLPRIPLIASKVAKKAKKPKERLLRGLTDRALCLGVFKIKKKSDAKPQNAPLATKCKSPITVKAQTTPSAKSAKRRPLVFPDAAIAKKRLFKELVSRKVKFRLENPRKARRCTLHLPGFPPIVADAPTRGARRSAFVEEAIKIGAIRLEK